jgi:hypothetical protein
MSIVSHELVYSSPNGTRLDVQYKFVDHLGNEILVNSLVPAGTDLTDDRIARIAGIEANQATDEVSSAVHHAQFGISPDIVPDYQTQADYDRRALGQFMTLADVNHFNEGRVLFLAMEARGGANANARAGYLGITRGTYNEIDARFSDLAGSQTFINDNKNQRWEDIPEEML